MGTANAMKYIRQRKAFQVACTIMGHEWNWLLPVDQTYIASDARQVLVNLYEDKRICSRCGEVKIAPMPKGWWRNIWPRGLLRISIGFNLFAAFAKVISTILKHL